MANLTELAKKKIAGVPVVYFALAAALALGFIAWRMKSTPDSSTPSDNSLQPGDQESTNPFAGLETQGTVVVAPQTPVAPDVVQQTNEDWVKAGADYASNDAKIASYGEAFEALTAYVNGEDLSFDQGKIKDAVLQKLKAPPEPIGKIGITASQPAQRQFTQLPGKHTVKGTNDNTPAKLCQLYYGTSDATHVNKLVEHNLTLGPASATYAVGTVVTIPVHQEPHYYTVTGTKNDWMFSTLASRYGLSALQLQALNPGVSQPIAKNTKIRYV